MTIDQRNECIICGEIYEEDWIQCYKRKDWVHAAGVDVIPSQPYYYCDFLKIKSGYVTVNYVFPGIPTKKVFVKH